MSIFFTRLSALATGLMAFSGAMAQETGAFSDRPNGAVVHISGFVCPGKIGVFARDAAGLRDPEREADYCAYSALSGIYGTIVVMPLPATFDPKIVLGSEFRTQEGTGGRILDEKIENFGSLPVYSRMYETTRLDNLQYRTLFTSAAVGAWAVQVVVEYADPRDKELKTAFVKAVYGEALKDIGAGE